MHYWFSKRILVLLSSIVLLSLFFVAFSSDAAFALIHGGAKIQVYGCAKDVVRAEVSGTNEGGYPAKWSSTWTKEWNNRPEKGTFETWNWYWKPNTLTQVTVWFADGSSYPEGVTIPYNNEVDPYHFNCYYIINGQGS
jgi:hypothetical protein